MAYHSNFMAQSNGIPWRTGGLGMGMGGHHAHSMVDQALHMSYHPGGDARDHILGVNSAFPSLRSEFAGSVFDPRKTVVAML